MSTANQAAAVPVDVRKAVRVWVLGTYGLDNPGIPVNLIEQVVIDGATIYRVEADVKDIVASPRRTPVYMAVITRPGSPIQVDLDSVVFFDEEE